MSAGSTDREAGASSPPAAPTKPEPILPPARSEAAVALTDLALGVEAAVFAVVLARTPDRSSRGVRIPLAASMAATAAAALTGAALHGLVPDRRDPRRRALWRLSLSSIGVAAVTSWALGARLALTGTTARAVERIAMAAHLPYLAAVWTGDRPYRLAVGSYLPGAVFLGGVLASRLRASRRRSSAALGLGGMAVTLVAAVVQVRRIGLGPRFDHDALYHALQGLGVALLFAAGRGLLGRAA